jgi:hypothetical protein
MILNADWLLGRRFSFVRTDDDGNVTSNDITIVSFDTFRERVRIHGDDGSRDWFPFASIVKMFQQGVIVESDKGGPFVLPDHEDQSISRWQPAKSR